MVAITDRRVAVPPECKVIHLYAVYEWNVIRTMTVPTTRLVLATCVSIPAEIKPTHVLKTPYANPYNTELYVDVRTACLWAIHLLIVKADLRNLSVVTMAIVPVGWLALM